MGKARIEEARALDLSAGGIGIHTEARLRLEQPVSVEFTLPLENVPLKVEARIRHSIDGRYGLSFIHLSEEQVRALQRVVH
jgi:c-di-GMP-binding flagellar brake protein YcgR